MIKKNWEELSTSEKFKLQKIVLKKRKYYNLSDEEELLYAKFSDRFIAEERKTKGKWPIIIALILVGLVSVVRRCS